jgi:hypothetical protein
MEFDGGKPVELNAADSGEWHENVAPTWAANVLRNAARAKISLGMLTAGRHRIRLIYCAASFNSRRFRWACSAL